MRTLSVSNPTPTSRPPAVYEPAQDRKQRALDLDDDINPWLHPGLGVADFEAESELPGASHSGASLDQAGPACHSA